MDSGSSGSVPRSVSALIVSFVPIYFALGFFQIVLGAWLVTVGYTPVQAGTLIAVDGIAFILASIPLGIISDIYGRKKLLLIGAFAGAAGFLAFSLTTNFVLMLVFCAVLGVADGAAVTTWNALLADMTDFSNRNKAFSLSFVVNNVSTGVGLLLPGLFPLITGPLGISSYAIHREALQVLGVASFITPVACFLVLRTLSESHGQGRKWAGLKNKAMMAKLGFTAGTIGFGAGFIIPLIGSWFYLRFGVSDSVTGPILALSNILIGTSAVASPWLASKFGQLRAVLLVTGSSMVFMITMAFVPFFALAAGVYIVRTALMNMSGPLMDSFSMGIFPPEQRGLVSAVSNIIFRFPNSVSTYFGGVILGLGLLQLPFFIAGGLYATGLAGFYIFFVANDRYAKALGSPGSHQGDDARI